MNQYYQHTPRKRFGQHFLTDENVIKQIVYAINPKPCQNLVEIGPGLGALTTHILPLCKKLNVVELDRDVIAPLKETCQPLGELTVYQQDVLQFDFNQLIKEAEPLRIIGNLPYNISTPLIFHLLNYHADIQDMHFMLQKEVVDRLVATPGKKDYGRLSIMLQYYCNAINLFEVPPGAFSPPPKVNSAVVRLIPHTTPPFKANNKKWLDDIVRAAFSQRRKTLRNCLKHIASSEELISLDIDPNARPETLSVEEFVRISNNIKE